jgi:dCTP deaminase
LLSKGEIQRLLNTSPLAERLIITPLLEDSQIGPNSIDLRLGFTFVLSRRANIPAVDPIAGDEATTAKYQERLSMSRGRKLYLHPGEFLLGASLEYVALPPKIGAYVTSRSSWGRAGLVIATATAVAPGFKGVITLELANIGTAPIVLRPGLRIAQILFHQTAEKTTYDGRYRCPTEPEAGKIHRDRDLSFWIS